MGLLIDSTLLIRAERNRLTGTRLPTSDLLIACTALSRGDEVVTGNVRHFRKVPGLTVQEWA